MNGLHLTADLYGCRCDAGLLLARTELERVCVDLCKQVDLTPLGTYFHQFTHDDGSDAGVTGTVVLAESHLAIHTWPESAEVTVDVYVCNFSRDNSSRARELLGSLIDVLSPSNDIINVLERGALSSTVSS